MSTTDPIVSAPASPAPATYDRRGSERRGRPRAPDDGAPSSDDVTGFLRVLRWGLANWKLVLSAVALVGAGRFARPEYVGAVTGLGPTPAIAQPVRVELDALHAVDSQLRRFADSARTASAAEKRESSGRFTAIARALCTLQTQPQREAGGLPCGTLLNGGNWDPGRLQ